MPQDTQDETDFAPLWDLAALLLAEAQDEEEHLITLLVLSLALHKLESNRHGLHGPYKQEKAEGFLELLLDKFSERMFKGFCGYVGV